MAPQHGAAKKQYTYSSNDGEKYHHRSPEKEPGARNLEKMALYPKNANNLPFPKYCNEEVCTYTANQKKEKEEKKSSQFMES